VNFILAMAHVILATKLTPQAVGRIPFKHWYLTVVESVLYLYILQVILWHSSANE
jgi:hypothetical protein